MILYEHSIDEKKGGKISNTELCICLLLGKVSASVSIAKVSKQAQHFFFHPDTRVCSQRNVSHSLTCTCISVCYCMCLRYSARTDHPSRYSLRTVQPCTERMCDEFVVKYSLIFNIPFAVRAYAWM